METYTTMIIDADSICELCSIDIAWYFSLIIVGICGNFKNQILHFIHLFCDLISNQLDFFIYSW